MGQRQQVSSTAAAAVSLAVAPPASDSVSRCRSYSYYIEVSMDELDWIRVVDHSKYLCRSWQNLFFTPRVCR